MFGSIFSFEVRRLLQSLSTYMYFTVLVVVTFFLALLAGGAFPSANFNIAGEKIFVNSPLIIDAFFSAINNYIGLIIIVAIVGNAVLKDFSNDTYTMIFTTPVTKFDYLFGRFAGSMFVTLFILVGPAFGLLLGYASPWVNPDKLEAARYLPYLYTYLQTTVPNALLLGAIFFSVSLIARDIFIIWLSLVIYFIATRLSSVLFSSLQLQTLAALVDPEGNFAKRSISKYWSTYDKNHLFYTLKGLFLLNRIVWVGIATIVWFLGYKFFSFSASPRQLITWKPKLADSSKVSFIPTFFNPAALPKTTVSFTTGNHLKSLWSLSLDECRSLWRNTYFRIILLFGMLLLFAISFQVGKIYDTQTLPVTYEMIEFFGGTFQLLIVVVTILFAGELVWKARQYKMSNILDALPVPNWVFYTSKLSGLFFMQIILQVIVLVCGILVQMIKGYTSFEVFLYIRYLFGIQLIDYMMLAVLAFFVQTLVKNKYMGFFIAGLFYFWNSAFATVVLKTNLLRFASDPGVTYSDMNGFGHVVYSFIIFKLYWGAFCLVLAVVSTLLWVRGTEDRLKQRWQGALVKANAASWRVAVIGLVLFSGLGGFIYYNTNILNKFYSDDQQEEMQANFEKKYRRYRNIPQPKITGVQINLDLYPNTLGLHANCVYNMRNKSLVAIDSVHINMPAGVKLNTLVFDKPYSLVYNDSYYKYMIYKLAKPLLPGETTAIIFDVDIVTKGFQQNFTGLSTPLYNGTFINNGNFLPTIGYNDGLELADNNRRKKYQLGYRPTSNSMKDSLLYNRKNLFVTDADFITFDATVSTVPDQIAVAPGYLKGEWVEKGRRYFHYVMDKPILNFYSFLSARYAVKKEQYKGINLEIYYQQGHEYNLDRMFNGMKKALEYYTSQFSNYQHKQVRILEFPRYATFAQSFPNTIPFSEGIGFIADVNDSSKEDIDYPFYVTTHEVAHQWFAHQVVGADVEGSNMLSESLAQYGAIMVLENEYGEDRLRKFLHLEMDKYLTARSNESEKEKPLAYADAGQGYILYQKGGIMMHALNKYLGTDSMNIAIRRFLDRYAFNAPPYPTTLDFVGYLRAVTPDSLQYIVTDAFTKIVIYDNKVTKATMKQDGETYQADFTVSSQKLVADSSGREKALPSENYIEIGIYKNRTQLLELKQYKLKQGETNLSMVFTEKPYKVVIDPRLLLIDKKLDDNEMRFDGK